MKTGAPTVRRLGVEEEFHLVDLETRRLTSRAEDILRALPDDIYVAEMLCCVVESNSSVFGDLAELRQNLLRNRHTQPSRRTVRCRRRRRRDRPPWRSRPTCS